MTEQNESDQTAQRHANFEQLRRLGVDVHPRRFEAGATVGDVVAAHGETSGADLETQGVQVRVAGRILGMRTFGKANFLVLSDGKARVQAAASSMCALMSTLFLAMSARNAVM